MRISAKLSLFGIVCAAGIMIANCSGCGGGATGDGGTSGPDKKGTAASGSVKIDGSDTVYPITQAVAEEFQKENQEIKPSVGQAGTGGGFKRFTAGETDISDASRPIEQKEMDIAKKNNIDFIEIPIAYDGITICVNKDNKFVDHITVEELKKIWVAGSTVKMWSDVRPSWPKEPIKLFGPSTNNGTFDYFTEVICGGKGKSRSDYQASVDYNVVVTGVAGEKGSLGFFGYSYYVNNKDKVKLVPIDSGKGAVSPDEKTIADRSYAPLSRPLFIYVSTKALDRPEVKKFVDYYLAHAADMVKEVGYVPLPQAIFDAAKKRYDDKTAGSAFAGTKPGTPLDEIYKAK